MRKQFGDIIQVGKPQCDYTGGGIWISVIPVEVNGERGLQVAYNTECLFDEDNQPEFWLERLVDDASPELAQEYGDNGYYVFDEKSPYYGLYTQLRQNLINTLDGYPEYRDYIKDGQWLNPKYDAFSQSYRVRDQYYKDNTPKTNAIRELLSGLGYKDVTVGESISYGFVIAQFNNYLTKKQFTEIKKQARAVLGCSSTLYHDLAILFDGGKLKNLKESLKEAADAGGVYIGNLDRFGYTLVCAGRTPQEVKASLIKEYKKAYRQRNNSMPDEDELRWADEEITPTFHKFGYVEWE